MYLNVTIYVGDDQKGNGEYWLEQRKTARVSGHGSELLIWILFVLFFYLIIVKLWGKLPKFSKLDFSSVKSGTITCFDFVKFKWDKECEVFSTVSSTGNLKINVSTIIFYIIFSYLEKSELFGSLVLYIVYNQPLNFT